MTRQKFYEECLIRTFQTAFDDFSNPMHEEMEKLGRITGLTLNEILMRRRLLGFGDIPSKENFKEWGVGYLSQLLGFVNSQDDCEFTRQFFSFLKKNRSLYKKKKDRTNFGNVCYYAFMDNCTRNRDFSQSLGSFMIFAFRGEEWFDDFLRVAYNLSLLDLDAIDEYQRIVYGSTMSERINEIMKTYSTGVVDETSEAN